MLSKDFKEFAELLDSNGVEYLIVGGYALAAYGHHQSQGFYDAMRADLALKGIAGKHLMYRRIGGNSTQGNA